MPSLVASAGSCMQSRAAAPSTRAVVSICNGVRPAQRPQQAVVQTAAIGTRSMTPFAASSCRRATIRCHAASTSDILVTEATGKFISRTEIPAFVQRDDMMSQLLLWANSEAGENGHRNFGLPMQVEPFNVDGVLWGYRVVILKDGKPLSGLSVQYDQLVTTKPEWVEQDQFGMPTPGGKMQDIKGKHLEIWKSDKEPVSEELREAIRAFCGGLVTAINKFYAFGSVFSEDI